MLCRGHNKAMKRNSSHNEPKDPSWTLLGHFYPYPLINKGTVLLPPVKNSLQQLITVSHKRHAVELTQLLMASTCKRIKEPLYVFKNLPNLSFKINHRLYLYISNPVSENQNIRITETNSSKIACVSTVPKTNPKHPK